MTTHHQAAPSLGARVAEAHRLHSLFGDADEAQLQAFQAEMDGFHTNILAVYRAPVGSLADAAAKLRAVLLWGGNENNPDDMAQVEAVAAFLETMGAH